MTYDSVFNLNEALGRVDHDRETFEMMVELFLEHGPKDLAETQAALGIQDAVGVARSSHRLKGAILQFCAPAALHACKALEETAKAGNLIHAEELYATLEQELLRLLDALRHECDTGHAA